MIEEEATVVEVNPEQIIVQTLRKSSCNSCSANKGCGTATLAKVIGQKHSLVSISKDKTIEPLLAVGDRVIIGINEGMLVNGSILAYLAPLAGMMGFALLASWLGSGFGAAGELHIILSAFIGLAFGLFISRLSITNGKRSTEFAPVLVRRLRDHSLSVSSVS